MRGEAAVIHVCEALASGILRVVPPLANETVERGIPTVVVHGRRPETPVDVTHVFDPRVRIVPVPGWGDRSPVGLLTTTLRAAAVLRREILRFEGGVIHLHSTNAGLVGRLVPAPGWTRFYTPQGYAFLNGSHPRTVRWLTLAAESLLAPRAHTVACSRTEGSEAKRLARGRSVSVVQNGVDGNSSPSATGARGERFVVASVGRAAYQRRPDLFAELTGLLGDDDGTAFYWFGDGPDRKLLADAGVVVSGWLTQAEVGAAIERADVLVHFSAFEGLPLALLEAMTAGRAVVASDLAVIREVVDDAGILVRDSFEAAEAVRKLRADDSFRNELAARAHDRARRLFTRQAMVERTLATYALAGRPFNRGVAAPGRG
jgi:glycosyltransferase involved in cell wall biosynthesis